MSDFFIQIRKAETIQSLLRQAQENHSIFLVRDARKPVIEAQLIRIDEGTSEPLILEYKYAETAPVWKSGAKLTLLFSLSHEKYLAKTHLIEQRAKKFVVQNLESLHKVQRRSDFRYMLPGHIEAMVRIGAGRYQMVDISAGGVRFAIPEAEKNKFSKGQQIPIELSIEGQEFRSLSLQVKRIAQQGELGLTVAGAFTFQEPSVELKLYQTVFQLERQSREQIRD